VDPVISASHVVQLFDSDESLATAAAAFLHRGYLCGERLGIIATASHWLDIATHLNHLGMPVAEALATQRATWVDANRALPAIARPEGIDEERLGALVEGLMGRRDGVHTPLRVYGEMVDLLAARGDFKAALELEGGWVRHLAHAPATLFCGYSAVHFGHPDTTGALNAICDLHDDVRTSRADALSAWLVAGRRAT
jgi:hypothetical protein